MRLRNLVVNEENITLGNTDRSLSAAAIVGIPSITTTPDPSSGYVGVTLNDTATLVGGFNPTGDVTFKLYLPSDPTCSGSPKLIVLDRSAPYTTAGSGCVSNVAGTWRWTADYAGDSNNLPASSGCEAEQVTIINPIGHLIVHKVTVPSSDTTTEFPISVSGTGAVTPPTSTNLTGGSSHNFEVIAGTYSAAETVPSGWDKTGDTCQNVVVAAGQTAECTITNTQRGHLIVQKTTYPAADQTVFTISASGSGTIIGGGAGTVTDANDKDYEVTPGTYSVAETVPSGWAKTGDTCQNVAVAAGETKYCLLTDVKPDAKITLSPLTGTNSINTPHSITATVKVDSGSGFVNAADGTLVTFSFSQNTIGAFFVGSVSTCTTASGSCSVSINSASPGTVKVHAATDVTVLAVALHRETNNTGGNSGDASKTYVAGNIIVDKVTIPAGDSQSFEFDPSWSASNFNLTDAATPHNSGNLAPGAYSVSESAVSGWTLASATCDDGSLISAIDLAASETVTCTFTNVKNPKITIVPTQTNEVGTPHTFTVTVGQQGSGAFVGIPGLYPTVTFSPSNPGTITDNCDDAGTDANGQCTVVINSASAGVFTAHASVSVTIGGHVFNIATDGTGGSSNNAVKTYIDAKINLTPLTGTNSINVAHTITATVMKNLGSGFVAANSVLVTFSLSSNTAGAAFVGNSTCTTNASGQCSVQINSATPGSVDIHGSVDVLIGSLTLHRETDSTHGSSGNANKVYQAGKIIIIKQTLPDGSSQSFEFDPSWSASNFNLTDGNQSNSGWLAPATYSVAEVNIPTGWDLTSATCSDGSPVSAIVLGAGETVTCTFTNTQRGHLIVDKVTIPAGDTTTLFPITASGNGSITAPASTNLTGGSSHNYEVTPGTYSVAETVPSGWQKTGDTCQNIVVGPGETKYCTITNTKLGKITIVKDAQPNDCKDFSFTGGLGAFILDDDHGVSECLIDPTDQPQSKTSSNLAVNTSYTINETVPSFWKLKSPIVCTGVDASQITQVANGVTISLLPGNEVTCTFVNVKLPSPTRTQGFWKTHTTFTSNIFTSKFSGGMILGSVSGYHITISNTCQLFAVWYSDVNFETTKIGKKQVKRDDVEKARILLAHQLITAKINCAAFGGCSSEINSLIASADAAYAGTSASNMNYWAGKLDSFNNSGDTIIISPPLPWQGKATPKDSQSVSLTCLSFWNNP